MTWHVVLSDSARRDLKKLDKHTQRIIIDWLDQHLEGCENPYASGKGLTENLAGFWRYRVGDYRILARIEHGTITIHVLRIGHRSKIYTV